MGSNPVGDSSKSEALALLDALGKGLQSKLVVSRHKVISAHLTSLVELVYTAVSKTAASGLDGSNPSRGTSFVCWFESSLGHHA